MSSKSRTVLVTGASGYLGSHIIIQLLRQGYRVRAVVRSSKANKLKSGYAALGFNDNDQLRIVPIADIAADQFPDAMSGVYGVIHTATPLPHATKYTSDSILKSTIDGTLNVLRQADLAGVKRFVATSSVSSVFNSRGSYTDQDWNDVTMEEALKTNGMDTYIASKAIIERAIWDYADKHPNIDVTTCISPWFYGPIADSTKIPEPDFPALSTAGLIYRLLAPDGTWPWFPPYIDVRDTARAHILALSAPFLGSRRRAKAFDLCIAV